MCAMRHRHTRDGSPEEGLATKSQNVYGSRTEGRGDSPVLIYIDVDGVLADLMSVWLQHHNTITGERRTHADITAFHFDVLPWATKTAEVWDSMCTRDILTTLPLNVGATELLKVLRRRGEVKALTAPLDRCDIWRECREEWLVRMCGFRPEEVCFARSTDKQFYASDVLIEDNAHTISQWRIQNESGVAHLVRTPYNPTGLHLWEIADLTRI